MSVHVESQKRSIIKTLSWRVIATFITLLVFAFTAKEMGGELIDTESAGVWEFASIGAMIDTAIKLFAYYGHERIWTKIGIGKAPTPECEI